MPDANLATVVAMASLGGGLLALIGFWLKVGNAISTASSTAKTALQTAAEAEVSLKELTKDFSDYRERAIEKFVMHDTMASLEKRITDAALQTEKRLGDAIADISDRIDQLISDIPKQKRVRR